MKLKNEVNILNNEQKLLQVIIEVDKSDFYVSSNYRLLAAAKLKYEDTIDFSIVNHEVTTDEINSLIKNEDARYILFIKDKHKITSDFFKKSIEYLKNKTVYLAEPYKFISTIPKNLEAIKLDNKYFFQKDTDIYGVFFNTLRFKDFLNAMSDYDRTALYINFRLYYSVGKVTPLTIGFSTNSNTALVNGIGLGEQTRKLFINSGIKTAELRIYVLKYLLLVLRRLKSSGEVQIHTNEFRMSVNFYNILTLESLVLLTDKIEFNFLKYLSGTGPHEFAFKELSDHTVNYKFSESSSIYDNEIVLYHIKFENKNINIIKFYQDKYKEVENKELHKFDFYSKKIDKNSIFIFMDRALQADDNAEYLYEYFIENYQDYPNAFFALHPRSRDWDRLNLKGFNLLPLWSPEFYEKFLYSDVVVSSQIYGINYKNKNFSNSRFVYLQHGIILTEMHDWIASKYFDLFVTTGKVEEEYLKSLAPKETINAGLPRLQTLYRQSDVQRNIVFMPTWRFNLNNLDDIKFVESDYFLAVNNILEDEKLNAYLADNNIYLKVKLHPNLMKRSHLFSFNDRVILTDESYREVISEAEFVFTDYSSVVLDAAFINIPIAYYQFDKEYFFMDQPYDQRVNYETDGLGPVFYSQENVIDYIIQEKYLNYSKKFIDRKNKFFEGVDKDNINRTIVERILSL